jgi:hypothetical protein
MNRNNVKRFKELFEAVDVEYVKNLLKNSKFTN